MTKYIVQDHKKLARRLFAVVRVIKNKTAYRNRTDAEQLAIDQLTEQAEEHQRAEMLFGGSFLMAKVNG